MIKRILVPLDQSERAATVLPLATALAQAASAELLLLCVIPDETPLDHFVGIDIEFTSDITEAYLARLVSQLLDRGVTARQSILRGDPARQIIACVASSDADLIVMATHGRGAADRWALGSVADAVTRGSPAPVLLGAPTAHDLPPTPVLPAHILIPLDGSPRAESIIPFALTLAELAYAQVSLLRVLGPQEVDGIQAPAAEPYDPEFVAVATVRQTQPARAYLQDVAARYPMSTLTVDFVVRIGSAAEEILEVATATNVNLIAMATHGRSGFKRFAFGSVSYQILQERHCPLLVLHEPATGDHVAAPLGRKV